MAPRLAATLAAIRSVAGSSGSLALNSADIAALAPLTLTPSGAGTHLRMEQSGFRADQNQAYQGAKAGWPRFIASLEQVLGRVD
jgi:hypothetical protein